MHSTFICFAPFMVCIHVWRCNMTRINTLRLWCFKEFITISTSISGELQSSSTRGRRLSCSNFDWRVSSAAPKSDFVPLSSKDPGQEALIIKPLLYYVFSTTIPLFRCTLYPLISTSNNSTLGLLSLYLTVYIITTLYFLPEPWLRTVPLQKLKESMFSH